MRNRAIFAALLGTVAMTLAVPASAKDAPIAYPVTEKVDTVEEQFGVKVEDPYRWLENDVRVDPKVAAWVEAQNKVTDAYLETLPGRAALAKRMRALYDFARTGVPREKGGRYFFTRNSGLQNQSVLYVKDSATAAERVLIDPNAWAKEGKGFYYSRFPEPDKAGEFQSLNTNQEIRYHALGTPQSADQLIYATPDEPKLNHVAELSDDGSFLLVTSSSGTDERYRLTMIDVANPAKRRVLVPELKNDWQMAGMAGDKIYFVTNKDAPRLKLVAMPVTGDESSIQTVVPEGEAVIDGASVIGGKLLVNYLKDAH